MQVALDLFVHAMVYSPFQKVVVLEALLSYAPVKKSE